MQEGEGSSHIKNTLQDDDQEVETEPAQPQEVRRSIRVKTQSVRLNDYGEFLGKSIR